MKLKIGTWMDDRTGEVKDRYLIFGKVMKDAEMRTVGAKGSQKLSLAISPGMGEDLETVTMWGYDAAAYNGTKKFTTMLIEAYENRREYMGKTYTDYIPLNVIDVSERRGKEPPRKRASKEVEPEDPYAGFTDISGDLPF